MFGQPFAHDELAKYTAIFGTLFNNISITRDDGDGNVIQSFKVPIGYGPREKYLSRTESDPNLDRPYAELLPRMAYELKDFEYDGDRKKPSVAKWSRRVNRPGNKLSYESMFMPVPYNFTFELTILANRTADAVRILGSILPFFRPEFPVTAAIVDSMPDYEIDIPIILKGVTPNEEYEGDYRKRRIIEYKLTFVMKAEIFGPVTESKIIKVAKVNMFGSTNGEYDQYALERYINQPGLTPDGKPTEDITKTISPLLIQETDPWGFIVTVEDGPIRD